MADRPRKDMITTQMSDHASGPSRLCVCIPTCKRSQMVRRLLANLREQYRQPDEILVVDSSPDDESAKVVAEWIPRFGTDMLRRILSTRGLTLQRNVGIDHTTCDLVCMLDDDVLLEPDCLEVMEAFMNSPEGQEFGGISAYVTNVFGKQFYKYQRLYHRLGLYEKLRPGCWLYCGDFLELSTLQPFEGIYRSEFIPGGTVMWRREVFKHIRPDSSFLFDGEDKHFSLKVSQHWAVGVLGQARMRHDHIPGGARRPPFVQGIRSMRNKAIMLRECDARPTIERYVAYLMYQPLDLLRMTLSYVVVGRWRQLPRLTGSWVGWLWNALFPPRRNPPMPTDAEW